MRLRKQRLAFGKSNKDYRNAKNKAFIYHKRKKNENYLDFLSKAKKIDEVKRYTKERLKLKTAPNRPDPSSQTESFYQT